MAKNNPILAAMPQTIDEPVGMNNNKFEELNLIDSTIFNYFSDNGSETFVAPVPPLNEEKTQLLVGGVRVPLFVSGSGGVVKGSVCNDYVTSTDFYTTILKLAPLETIDVQGLISGTCFINVVAKLKPKYQN